MHYKEELEKILADMEARRSLCQKEIRHLPKGTMYVENNRGYVQYRRYYEWDGKTMRESISKDPEMIRLMQRKEYYEKELVVLDEDVAKLRSVSDSINGNDFDTVRGKLRYGAEEITLEDVFISSASGLLIPRPVRDADIPIRELELHLGNTDPYEWATMPYRENTSYLEDKHHVGMTGLNYRSRAELHIFEHIITKRKHPIHYDEVIEIDGEYFSPDGIAPNRRGEIILIEYMEKDDKDYLRRNSRKFEAYRSKGFVPGRNLVVLSCETKDFINTPKLDKIMDAYLLL